MWSHHDLAQGMGKELGIGAVLLRCLPWQEVRQTGVARGQKRWS
jgi:hypothetical protein